MIYVYFSFAFFILGAITTSFRKFSYTMATIASTFAFIAAVVGMNAPFHSGTYVLLKGVGLSVGVDHTSAIFLIMASISWFAISLYSIDYGMNYSKKMPIFFNGALFGIFLALTARDALTFVSGWEIATIFSYLLIMEHKNSFKEAFDFLAFGEISTVSLLVAFAALYLHNHSLILIGTHGTWIFLLMSTIAFTTKMGIYPLHTWLVGAHTRAPSNASAILSAPLTLMGVYGLVRALSVSGQPEWWGILAMLFGGFSAFWGALQAASAKGLKILPAYSTVENNGMILAALGLSVTAHSANLTVLSSFAMITSLILLFAHNTAKSLLFMAVGHAKEALGQETIDDVRGIWTAVGKIPAISILTSGLSFSAFPPLIGFLGEWMTLEALFQSYKFSSMLDRLSAAFAGILVALAMGLAAFSMAKLVGYSALGYDHGKKAKKIPSFTMNISEVFLSLTILLAGLFSPYLIGYFGYGDFLSGLFGVPKPFLIVSSHPVFGVVSPTFLAVVAGVIFLFPLAFYVSKSKKVKRVSAWNGGIPLKEGEYFSVPAYSFTLEFILRKVYSTKEIKKGKVRYVSVKDITTLLYDGIASTTKATSKALSITLMNGHIYSYILYAMIMFVMIFFVAR